MAKASSFPETGDGDHMGMFPQLVHGVSQKGDTRPKVVSNRTV